MSEDRKAACANEGLLYNRFLKVSKWTWFEGLCGNIQPRCLFWQKVAHFFNKRKE